MSLVLLTAAIAVLIVLRVPVAFALLIPCFGYLGLDSTVNLGIGLQQLAGSVDSFPLLAVPLFIMTGYLANAAGIAERLVEFGMRLFGRVRGSLGYVNVSTSVGFSWMSGAVLADAAGLGAVLVPQMKKRGYDEGFAVGLTGSSALLGPLMPPSIAAIVYAVTAGVSIGGMFLAGIVPALVLAAVLCVVVFLYARRNPAIQPERFDARALARATWRVLPVIATPVIIIGGILGGVFTPTEAAAVAVTYLLLVATIGRWTSAKAVWSVLVNTARTTGQIMLIVSAGGLFAWILAREGAPQAIASLILDFTSDPLIFLLLVIVVLLVVGIAVESVTALIVTVPVLYPIAVQLGIDPLHLGVVMIFALLLGNLTPPVALVLFVICSVTDAKFDRALRGSLPFFVPLLIALFIITLVEGISLTLPGLAGLSQ